MSPTPPPDLLPAADAWIATDDIDGDLDPSLAHLFQSGPGSGAPITATSASLSFDDIEYTFSVTVPAGGRVAILHFAIQTMTQAAAQAEAARLVELPDDAWVGLEEYETDIVNFPPRTILADCRGARVGARRDDGLFCTRTDRCTAAGTPIRIWRGLWNRHLGVGAVASLFQLGARQVRG